MNPKIINYLLIVLLVINLILILIVSLQVKKAQEECLKDPLVYGARKIKESNNAEFSCSCGLAIPNSPIITFNSERFNVESPKTEDSYSAWKEFNLSQFTPND